MAVTIHDVAKKAGVSPATVSLIYNQTEHAKRMTEATRQRVMAAISELGYQPNAGARSIRLKRYESVGVNFSGTIQSMTPGHFYPQVLAGIEDAVAEGSFLCIMSRNHHLSPDVPKFIRMRCVDGFIALHSLNEATYTAAAGARIPLLAVNSRGPVGTPSVVYDDAKAATQVLERLWAKGHRRVAYVTSNVDHESTAERMRAYVEWTSQRGLPCWISPVYDAMNHGIDEIYSWLTSRTRDPQPITAVLFYNQHTLFEFIRQQSHSTPLIPNVISAASCEQSPHSWFKHESLRPAGMRYEPFEMGRLAGKAMIDHICNNKPLQDVVMEPEWIEGNTLATL